MPFINKFFNECDYDWTIFRSFETWSVVEDFFERFSNSSANEYFAALNAGFFPNEETRRKTHA